LKSSVQLGVICLSFVLAVGCSGPAASPQAAAVSDKAITKALDPANMDATIRPGDDFFSFANGSYLANLEIPEDRSSYDAFDILREETAQDVRDLLDKVSKDSSAEKGSIAQKIRDFYNSAMDEATVDTLGITPLEAEFSKIDAMSSKQDLVGVLANFHQFDVTPFFGGTVFEDLMDNTRFRFYFIQSGTALPDVEYYTKDDDRSQEIRVAYLDHVQAMFVLLGNESGEAKQAAETVMTIETRLAENSRSRLQMRNIPALYNKMSTNELAKQAPAFDWKAYLATLSGTDFGDVVVGMPEYFEAMSSVIEDTAVDELKTYLRWQLLDSMAPYLSTPFVNQNQKFYGEFLSGNPKIKPRWERVVNVTNDLLGEPVGQLYVAEHFPQESKDRMLELVENLKITMNSRLEQLDWMSDETKAAALAKLAAMRVKIGYPDKWEDFSKLVIETDAYVSNAIRAKHFAYRKQLDKFGKPVDPDEWPFPPQIVNAGYSPIKNDITFPAGILQPPYFNPDADDAVNYGAIGVVIGHEMTHGFDDQGRRFDKSGNMTDWWTAADEAEFNKRTKLLVDQYSDFSALDGVHVNGELTLGENIADFGGLTIAYQAYKASLEGKPKPAAIDGFTDDQRYFLSYAQLWRGKIRDEALRRQMVEDVHPWGEFRTNGALFNVPQFYDVFDIKEGDQLYRTPEQRPVIW